ncbi:MAG: hypothetical protein IIA88_10330 [Bacteroidetes bacterium]|nr:hypothetical protein [Bacteroidota bacterium]
MFTFVFTILAFLTIIALIGTLTNKLVRTMQLLLFMTFLLFFYFIVLLLQPITNQYLKEDNGMILILFAIIAALLHFPYHWLEALLQKQILKEEKRKKKEKNRL